MNNMEGAAASQRAHHTRATAVQDDREGEAGVTNRL